MVIAAGLLLAGCGDDQAGPPQAPAPEVSVAPPHVAEIIDWDDYIGRFEAMDTVEIRPRVSGYITAVHFEDGERVAEGDVLFTIDARPFEAQLDQAQGQVAEVEARLENLRRRLKRQSELVETQAVSQETFETTQSEVSAAEAELRAARATAQAQALNLGFTEVKAPIDGRVSYRRVDIGNAVTADQTVLTVVNSLDPIHFVFQGSEALYLKYKREDMASGEEGTPVRIRLQDEAEYDWTGHLDFMDSMISAGTGTVRGRAVIDNPDHFLVPGMFGHMQLQGSRPYKGIMVPDAAVATQGGQRVVYVVNAEGIVAVKPVTLGPLRGDLRVIRSGLTPNDRVIVDGQQRARPGQPVQAQETTIDATGTLAFEAPGDR